MRWRVPSICVRLMYFFNFGCRGLAMSCVEIALNISVYIVVAISRVKEGGGECSSDIKSATEFGGQEYTILVWTVGVVCWMMKMIHIPCVLSHILDHSKEQSPYGPLVSVEAVICALAQFWDFINLRNIALTNFLMIKSVYVWWQMSSLSMSTCTRLHFTQ